MHFQQTKSGPLDNASSHFKPSGYLHAGNHKGAQVRLITLCARSECCTWQAGGATGSGQSFSCAGTREPRDSVTEPGNGEVDSGASEEGAGWACSMRKGADQFGRGRQRVMVRPSVARPVGPGLDIADAKQGVGGPASTQRLVRGAGGAALTSTRCRFGRYHRRNMN